MSEHQEVDPPVQNPAALSSAERRRLVQEGKQKRRNLRQKSRDSRAKRLNSINRDGFFWALPMAPVIVEPEGYDPTQGFRKDVSEYFGSEVDLFPDDYGELFPRFFDDFHRNEIGDKFPSDKAARDLCELIRYVLVANQSMLVKLKLALTAAFLVFSLVVLVALFGFHVAGHRYVETFGLLALTAAIAALLYIVFIWASYSSFLRKSQQSCARAETSLQSVFNAIDPRYRDAIEKIQSDESRGDDDMKRDWPVRAAWWAKLIMWYPKRVEYLEKVFQIAMWRVRYSFALWRVLGWGLLAVLGVAFAAASLFLGGWTKIGWAPAMTMAAFAALVVFAGNYFWSPPLDFARENLRTDHWSRFKNFRSEERFAELVGHFINRLISEQRPH